MSVSTVITALQTEWATLSGVTKAPTAMPASLNTADLPMALSFPGPGQWNLHSLTLKRQERNYVVKVYLAPVAQGQGVDEGFQDTVTLMQTFGAAALDWPTWKSTSFENITSITDNGHEILSFAELNYHGFTLTLTVVEKPL